MRYFGIVLAFLMAATATLLFGTSASADASGIQFMGQGMQAPMANTHGTQSTSRTFARLSILATRKLGPYA